MKRMVVAASVVALGLSLVGVPGTAAADDVINAGTFVGASNHVTTGGVEIVATDDGHVVRLKPDFSLDGAPDPKLGFGNGGSYDAATTFAVLESLTGEQSYAVPAAIDPTQYDEFYIWCEQFSVPLGVAKLQ